MKINRQLSDYIWLFVYTYAGTSVSCSAMNVLVEKKNNVWLWSVSLCWFPKKIICWYCFPGPTQIIFTSKCVFFFTIVKENCPYRSIKARTPHPNNINKILMCTVVYSSFIRNTIRLYRVHSENVFIFLIACIYTKYIYNKNLT